MNIDLTQIKAWVLAPYLVTNDEHIDYYYDFSQSIEEYTRVFAELGMEWQWQPVTMDDYRTVIDGIAKEKKSNKHPLVFNLCDGDEVNGTPGISVIHYLEEKQLLYTGASAYFYDVTTSKIPMKRAFDKQQVPTAKWEAIHSKEQSIDGIFDRLGSPIIVKPSVSGGSMGVGTRNVVSTIEELCEQVSRMFEGYRGWQLTTDGIIAESFVDGPEYTVMIVGNYNHPEKAIIYTPVERVFHPSLPAHEKFLSFDRLWEIYEEEGPMPNEENFYEYAVADTALYERLKQLSWDAYAACKGIGYTRVDLRMDSATGELLVLEVNAQCGLSEDENFTSIGAILKYSGVSFTQLVKQVLENTLSNADSKALKSIKHKLKAA